MSLDLLHGSASSWSRDIAARALTSAELVENCLARIERLDGRLGAFTEVYADEARMASQAADRAIAAGYYLGPLHGLPIAVKDLVEIEGKVVMGGSAVWRQRVAVRTATLAKRLVGAGAIIVGKTHTVEFAFGGWGTNQHLGTPWNPWDLEAARTPGGSSSGSAVAVAASMVPWAIGTDTGGSIRIPASWCGLTGLKTSAGRISNYGVLPLSATLDTAGPMAYSADDVALLYGALCGPDPLDERTLGLPPSAGAVTRSLKGKRLARMPESERQYAGAHTLAAYDRSLDELADLGADIVELPMPFSFADVARLNGVIMSSEGYAQLGDMVADPALPLDDDVRPRILAGRGMAAKDYIEALHRRNEMIVQFDAVMAGCDALLLPSTPTTALPLAEVDQTQAPSHFTRFANFLDLCAVSVPNGADDRGLPTSLQIVGRRFHEWPTLALAQAYQRCADWHVRRPTGLA